MIAQNTILDLVGSVPMGIIVVQRNRQVISLNRRAREITERADSLVIRNNALSGVESGQTSKLERLIAGAINGGNGSPNSMTIFRDSSNWPIWVLVVPLESHCAAVLISDPERRCPPSNQVLSALFGLTPTESRLASLLAQGASLLEAASELDITPQSARAYLKVIFQKTGANRQNHLTYLLLSSPAPISVCGMEAQFTEAWKTAPAWNKNGKKGNKSVSRAMW